MRTLPGKSSRGGHTSRFTYTDDGEHEAVLDKSSGGGLFSMIFLLGFFVVWYHSIFSKAFFSPKGVLPAAVDMLRAKPGIWILVLSPLFIIVPAVSAVQQTIKGRRFRFDRGAREIFEGGERFSSFDDLASVEVRPAAAANGVPTNRLLVVLKDGTYKTLIEDLDFDGLCTVAGQLSELTGAAFKKP
jgi:hypothetical protein